MKRHHRLPRRIAVLVLTTIAIGAAVAAGHGGALAADTWRGLTVAPEHRCTHYDRAAYPYSQSVEAEIVASMGGAIYEPYTGRFFPTRRQTDVDHIVAFSEAHDSGLCAAGPLLRRRFASDLLNLTLAAPEVNRCGDGGKCAYDSAEWLPPMNRCWFAARVVAVKRKYALTVDRREAAILERVLSGCASTNMIVTRPGGPAEPPRRATASTSDALRLYDTNRNGRITCKEARSHGIAPVPRGHPAYALMYDRDGDGMVCE